MAKRGADEQITRENISEIEEGDGSPQTVAKADSGVMAKRKILIPRAKKLAGSDDLNQGMKNSGGNSFSEIFKNKNFDFGKQKNSLDAKAFNVETHVNEDTKSKNEKIKALNTKFISVLRDADTENTVADFTEAAKKYIEYYEKIKLTNGEDSKSTTNNFEPSKQKSGFTFQPQTNVSSSQHPESSSLRNSVLSTSSSGLPSKPLFSFTNQISQNTKSNLNQESPQENKQDKPFSLFSDKDGFSSKRDSNLPGAEGGQERESHDTERTAPAGAFGQSQTSVPQIEHSELSKEDSSTQVNHPKPTFTFGTKLNGNPALSKNEFSSGGMMESKHPSASIFGSSAGNNISGERKPFSFNSTDNQSSDQTSKPVFGGFNKTSGFSFSQNNQASSFKEKSDNNLDSPEKKFQSERSNENPSAPTSAHNTNDVFHLQQDKPAFNFGSTVLNSQANDFTSLFKPSTGGFGSNKTTFSSSEKDINSTNKNEHETEEENMPEEDTGATFQPIAQLSSQKVESQTGEEDEEVLFNKRTKLMLLDPSNRDSPYTSKGLGDLKVLTGKNGKTRLLMRAEGSLRVLLNEFVNKDMSYAALGNGSMIRIPSINSDTSKIDTYVIKLKTAKDGEELLKVLNERD